MSFVDLATLAMHLRHELEGRISSFVKKCDEAQCNLRNFKLQGQGMVAQLNCEPTELKDKFLNCMKQLDEYIYVVTDFNLSVGTLVEIANNDHYVSPSMTLDVVSNLSTTPVPDLPKYQTLTPKMEKNLLDVLSEPNRAVSTACANQCPVQKRKKKKVKENVLIDFSSGSSRESVPTQESVPSPGSVPIHTKHTVERETQCEAEMVQLKELSLHETAGAACLPEDRAEGAWNLPAQSVLQVGTVHKGCIMHVDENCLWIITENIHEAKKLMVDMQKYYLENPGCVTREQAKSLTYCSYYDDESVCSYRCLLLKLEADVAELFLVDTGEIRQAPLSMIQKLPRRFCTLPPFARCCYLAGIEPLCTDDEGFIAKQEEFFKKFLGQYLDIEIDDNTSEALYVYINLGEQSLNQLAVAEGYAVPIENPKVLPKPEHSTKEKPIKETPLKETKHFGPPEILNNADFSIDDCPEYEDPLEAVTGYHNRDEADICKHYKGGAKKTCFKGAKCKKKHIRKHPDGWTLDKIEVTGKGRMLPLPAPDTWLRVKISCVAHFDHVFIQLTDNNNVEEPMRSFGVVLPPSSLDSLVRDMNSPASRTAMKPLKIAPAPGELVAALYCDDQWYRAQVLSHTYHDQNVEVRFIDYGTELWVKEDKVKQLDPCYTVLPFQAIRCRLAGVQPKGQEAAVWADAKAALCTMVLDRIVECHVIARNYDELEVELFDAEGNNIADKLAESELVLLTDYCVQDDTNCTVKTIVP